MFFSLSIAAILLKDNAPPAAHWPQEGRGGYSTTTKPALKLSQIIGMERAMSF